MAETLTKDLMAEKIHARGYPAKESRAMVEIIIEAIKAELEEGKSVKISGFGKWDVRSKRERQGRNPHTGEKIEISKRRVITFHPSDRLREKIDENHKAR